MQSTLTRREIWYGRDEPLASRMPLRAGALEMQFEAGDLRYLRWGSTEIVRRIYAAVRDRNWATIAGRLSHVQLDVAQDSFSISYQSHHQQGDINFLWWARIEGTAEGRVRFKFEGEALSTFLRNRIGFCVLHPASVAGSTALVQQVNSTTTRAQFPKSIQPSAPFAEIRSIAHQVEPGAWVKVEFEGDIFEMEDQRNWLDASFKTFCTPLRFPFPVEVSRGTRIEQAVTLSMECQLPLPDRGASAAIVRSPEAVKIDLRTGPLPLPQIGFGMSSQVPVLNPAQIARVRALHPAHLRVDIALAHDGFVGEMQRAADLAHALGIGCEVAVTLTGEAERELALLAAESLRRAWPIERWIIFHTAEKATSARWIKLARERLHSLGRPVGAGTNAYFTELNRSRPPADAVDFLCYSVNPQVHAFDNASIIETLPMHAATLASARSFAGGQPILITPITFRPRFNPDATGPAPAPARGELPDSVDPRQMSLFGAAWTLASLKSVAEGGAASVTYYETVGWRGLMEREEGSLVPARFRSSPGAVFPLYHVFAEVAEASGGKVRPAATSDPLQADALALDDAGRSRLLVANLTAEPVEVQVLGGAERWRLRRLNEDTAEVAMHRPEEFRRWPREDGLRADGLKLRPYEFVSAEFV